MTEKLVTAIGTTTINSETKVRFTSDLATRTKNWSRVGVDAQFVSLPHAMTRLDALYYLQTHQEFQSSSQQRAIWEQIFFKEALIKRDKRRAVRQARSTTVTKKMSLSEIRERGTVTL